MDDHIPFRRKWMTIHAVGDNRLPLCGSRSNGRCVTRNRDDVTCEECQTKLWAKDWAKKLKETEVVDARD